MNVKFKLVDKHKRSVLSEGRNKGLGFSWCIKKDDTLITLYSPSCCKDFAAEQLAAQHIGTYSSYGLTGQKNDDFIQKGKAYGVLAVLKQGASSPQRYAGFEKEYEQLATNYKNIQLGLNKIEDQIKVSRSQISRIEANRYSIEIDEYWTTRTYLFSLHALVTRMLMTYDGKSDVVDFLSKVKNEDTYMMNSAMPKLKKLLNGFKVPPEDWTVSRSWHNYGILAANVF